MVRQLAELVNFDGVFWDGRDVAITGMSADSRAIKPGYLFAALPGTKMDGAQFAAAAIRAGAVAVLCDRQAKFDGMEAASIIRTDQPRLMLALMAAKFYDAQPKTAVAVTGTNGKTSVVSFVRQIWEVMGLKAASMGTVGVVAPGFSEKLEHTTPDPVQVQALMAQLAKAGVDHVAVEASSHGLAQNRLDGLKLQAGGFTNLSRDHLDYHADTADYFMAKAGLFSRLLPAGAVAVIASDANEAGDDMAKIALGNGLSVMRVGHNGDRLRLRGQRRSGFGQHLTIKGQDDVYEIYLPLVGDFQASNALVAAGLVIAAGGVEAAAVNALEKLTGARGRLDLVGQTKDEAAIFVDYAHTPDALATALLALRPYVKKRLVVVFGCGGDRDAGKRPQMGQMAMEHADKVYVTDDNPRSENAAAIRAEIMAAATDAQEIGDRAEAIKTAISNLKNGDILLVAGKGHEQGQIIGDQVLPFSDHDVVNEVLSGAM